MTHAVGTAAVEMLFGGLLSGFTGWIERWHSFCPSWVRDGQGQQQSADQLDAKKAWPHFRDCARRWTLKAIHGAGWSS